MKNFINSFLNVLNFAKDLNFNLLIFILCMAGALTFVATIFLSFLSIKIKYNDKYYFYCFTNILTTVIYFFCLIESYVVGSFCIITASAFAALIHLIFKLMYYGLQLLTPKIKEIPNDNLQKLLLKDEKSSVYMKPVQSNGYFYRPEPFEGECDVDSEAVYDIVNTLLKSNPSPTDKCELSSIVYEMDKYRLNHDKMGMKRLNLKLQELLRLMSKYKYDSLKNVTE